MSIPAIITALCGFGFLPTPSCPFVLRADVVQSLQGGPIAIRVQVRPIKKTSPGALPVEVDIEQLRRLTPPTTGQVQGPQCWGPPVRGAEILSGRQKYFIMPEQGCST